MQTPFEMAWVILKQGQLGRIGPDSLMSHRNPIEPSRGQSQYRSNSLMDSAYAGRGTPPPPPRDTSLDEFTDKLQFGQPHIRPHDADGLTHDMEEELNTDMQFRERSPQLGSAPVEMSDIQRYQKETDFHNTYGPNSYNNLG